MAPSIFCGWHQNGIDTNDDVIIKDDVMIKQVVLVNVMGAFFIPRYHSPISILIKTGTRADPIITFHWRQCNTTPFRDQRQGRILVLPGELVDLRTCL
jgi:hypothetical protein